MSTPRSAAPTKRTASLEVLFSGFPSGVSLVTVAVSLISTCSVAVSDTRIVVRPPAGSEPRLQVIVPSASAQAPSRSEEHTSELQSQSNLVCRLLLEKKKKKKDIERKSSIQHQQHTS